MIIGDVNVEITGAKETVYNPTMDDAPVIDKDTKFTRIPEGRAEKVIINVQDDGTPTMMFIRIMSVQNNHVKEVQVISELKFNTFQDLKQLSQTIANSIKRHEEREP